MSSCRGSFRALLFYDVADEIRLDVLRELIGVSPPGRKPEFKLPAPVYVRFERPPVVEAAETVRLSTGESFDARLKYFDYGVVSLELQRPFQADWHELIRLTNRWIEQPEIEQIALQIVRKRLEGLRQALSKPYAEWLDEVYYSLHVCPVELAGNRVLPAADLLAENGSAIAQIVRGDVNPLSPSEEREVLGSSMSYYPTDLLVVGWMAAFLYDTVEGAATTVQLLEYANTQLLEYRRYDEVLTRVLKRAYDSLEHGGGYLRRWRYARQATNLNTLRLDITELTERTDNAIKFLSDMFYARAYQLASAKIGVKDYRHLVEEKLRTAGELYDFMVNEFRQARGFVLEVLVVVMILIEILQAFRGH
jgi:hypothetical protein